MVAYMLTVTLLLCVTYIAVCARNWNKTCAKAKARMLNRKED